MNEAMGGFLTDLTGTRMCGECLKRVPEDLADTPECPGCKGDE